MKGPKAAAAASSPFEFRDIVLGKVKGHPAWPARVVDPATAPDNLRNPKKMTSKSRYLVKFFQSGDYAWLVDRDISKLESHEIQAFLDNPHKKGADLKVAYQIAKDPEEWEAEQTRVADEEEAERQQNIKEDDAREEDELEEEAQVEGKKRKRATEDKPKEAKKHKSASSGRKMRGRAQEPVNVVWDWRHHLQREFLSKSEPTEDSMSNMDETFKAIEAFKMQLDWLQTTKLGKVLKRIGQLPDEKVPLDSQYQFRERAKALQNKWAAEFGISDEKPTVPVEEAAIETGIDPSLIPQNLQETEAPNGQVPAAVDAEEVAAATEAVDAIEAEEVEEAAEEGPEPQINGNGSKHAEEPDTEMQQAQNEEVYQEATVEPADMDLDKMDESSSPSSALPNPTTNGV